MSIISVKNLSKTFESYKKQPGLKGAFKALFSREKIFKKAVKDVSFEIGKGELVGFLGPNGAGKTTTLKMLAGILYPTGGSAKILGFVPWERKNEYKKQFAFVMGQKSQLWWDLPPLETFILNREIYEIDKKVFERTLGELVELLGIEDIIKVPVRNLSLGQRMKCEIVASLIHSPKVLFLDEPTIGLDVIAQKKMRDFVKHYNEERKTTIILTSHYMEDIVALAKRVIIIDSGEIIYDGPIASLIEKYAPYKLLKITFEKNIKKYDLEKFVPLPRKNSGEASPPSHKHYGEASKVVSLGGNIFQIEVPRAESARIAGEILNKFPVDDILIDEPEARDIIRMIFEKKKA